jgi:tetratricopeptide (TPR) repeat protein
VVTVLFHSSVDFPLRLPGSALAFSALSGLLLSRWAQPASTTTTVLLKPFTVYALTAGSLLSSLVLVSFAVRDFIGNMYTERGRSLLQQERFASASWMFERSLSFSFSPGYSLAVLGSIDAFMQNHKDCVRRLEQASQSFSAEGIYYFWGSCLLNLGDVEAALRKFAQVAAMDPHTSLKAKLKEELTSLYAQAQRQWAKAKGFEERGKALRWLDGLAAVARAGPFLHWESEREIERLRAQWRIESGLGGGRREALAILQGMSKRWPDDIPTYLLLARVDPPGKRFLKKASELVERKRLIVETRLQAPDLPNKKAKSLHRELRQLERWYFQIKQGQ